MIILYKTSVYQKNSFDDTFVIDFIKHFHIYFLNAKRLHSNEISEVPRRKPGTRMPSWTIWIFAWWPHQSPGFMPADLRERRVDGTSLKVVTILPFRMCEDWLLKPHWMIILVYFAQCHANPSLILSWQYCCAWRHDTFIGNFRQLKMPPLFPVPLKRLVVCRARHVF